MDPGYVRSLGDFSLSILRGGDVFRRGMKSKRKAGVKGACGRSRETHCLKLGSLIIHSLQKKWPAQKVTNMLMMLELVRILVSPTNPNANANQMAMNKQGTLETILRLTLKDDKLPEKVQCLSFF